MRRTAMRASAEERAWGALGAALIVGLMGYMLLFGLPVTLHIHRDEAITVLDVHTPPPAQRLKTPVAPPKHAKAAGKPARHSLENKASPIVTPLPVLPPPPTPVVAALQPGLGTTAAMGASDRPGPGEGAGGQGNGTGGGSDDDGDGGGAGDTPPRFVKGRLKFSDLPASIRDGGVGGTVSVRYEVETNGRVDECVVTGSSGDAELDRLTCQLIEQRFRYEPSRTPDGAPVASSVEGRHNWTNDRHPPTRPFSSVEGPDGFH